MEIAVILVKTLVTNSYFGIHILKAQTIHAAAVGPGAARRGAWGGGGARTVGATAPPWGPGPSTGLGAAWPWGEGGERGIRYHQFVWIQI